MSARATRPRSRRGRHAAPGELDPVVEETEAAPGGSEPGPAPPPGSCGTGQGLESRTNQEADGVSSKGPAPAPEGPSNPAEKEAADPEAAPPEPGTPDLFRSLQRALTSLEAAAAAWRQRPPRRPEPPRGEGGSGGAVGPCGERDGAGGCWREAARLAERNAWLQLALGSREDELGRLQDTLRAARAEKDVLQREVQELQDSLLRLESFPPPSHSQVGRSGSGSSSSGPDGDLWGAQEPSSPAHPLLRRVRSNSSTQVLGPLPTVSLTPEMHVLEAQMEQLQGSIEKLKCFNRLLSAVLQAYKGRCEGLSMQLGQLEAEATALRLALQYSEDCEEVYGVLLALWEANSGAGDGAPPGALQAAEEEAWRLLAQEEAAVDGDPQSSPEGSSMDRPTAQEAAAQLRAYLQRLRQRRALVKITPKPGPALAPVPSVPRTEVTLQAMLGSQSGPALPRLEKSQIQRELAAARETLGDLALRLQTARREKRCLELQEAALRVQGPALALLVEQLRWERAQARAGQASGDDSSEGGSSGDEEDWAPGLPAIPSGASGTASGQGGPARTPEEVAQELAASLTRALDLREQLRTVRNSLEEAAQKERARWAQSAELSSDLCKAHSALVRAFRGTHRKQDEQQWKLEQQVALLEARHAGELAVLGAAARALGTPGTPRPPPRLGETLL